MDKMPKMQKENIGKLYEYGNNFIFEPHKYGYVNMYQVGEIYSYCGYEVSEHTQLCSEISYVISGTGEFLVNGKSYTVKAGDIFLNVFGERHQIYSSGKDGLRFFYLGFLIDQSSAWQNEDLNKLWQFYSIPHEVPLMQGSEDILRAMQSLNNEFYQENELSLLAQENLLKQILVDVYRIFRDKKETTILVSNEGYNAGNVIFNIVRYVDTHIFEVTRIQDIAQNLGYSVSYLSHLFSEKMGITAQQYLISRRIEKCREMMMSGEYNLTQIAEKLNYDSLQSFSRAFKKVMNISPSDYCKKIKNKK